MELMMMAMQAEIEEDDEEKISATLIMGDRKNEPKYEIFVKQLFEQMRKKYKQDLEFPEQEGRPSLSGCGRRCRSPMQDRCGGLIF